MLFYNRENIALANNGELLFVELHFCSRVLACNNSVADFYIHGYLFAVNESARADRENFRDLGFFLCRGRKDDAAACGFFANLFFIPSTIFIIYKDETTDLSAQY